MEATKEQLENQYQSLKELIEKADYELVYDDGLLEELKIQIDIFSLCMERTIAGGFDKPTENELKNMVSYWHQLSENLRTALELLQMAQTTVKGLEYNPDKKGDFIGIDSLNYRLNGTNNS